MNFKLALFDVDSTLIANEIIDELASLNGKSSEVSEITEMAMLGKIDFSQSLQKRVKLLTGLHVERFDDVLKVINFQPGALDLLAYLKSKGFKIGIVSGGFIQLLQLVFKDVTFDYLRANSLEIKENYLTGKIQGEIVDGKVKRESLLEFAQSFDIPLQETIAIGDGANDILMIERAGLGIAFKGKPILREAADLCFDRSLMEIADFLERQL
jgi:phosphoserine phosphatase